ncbi:hypothetical protein MRB53_035788 [Persea americana]|uniref:Uncharacterized protein n=1 Tax=Persea americana TaxID=3435 RepID=A0ACC2K5X0_PERAE|nr:hypothetical protein MRB53_035788 [Persea americana]
MCNYRSNAIGVINMPGSSQDQSFEGMQIPLVRGRLEMRNKSVTAYTESNSGGPANISFNPYAVPSSASRIFPMPLNNGSDYIGSSSNHGIAGIGVDEYGRNHHLMDNVRGSGKRKNAEGLPGNYYYTNGPASSSSSSLGVPMNSGPQQREEPYVPRIGALEAATFNPSEYNGSGVLSTTEGPQRTMEAFPIGTMDLLGQICTDVAMMEYSGFFGVGNFIDQHRDMRLDIDDMSYEELLALEERIGDVSTGLSEETISSCLKTRRYVPCTVSSPSDQPADMVMPDKETCIICQAEYEESEKIGILDCGHDYHADCIKQWLLVKNACPICKASALAVDKKNE